MNIDNNTKFHKLVDGRALSYAEFGDMNGKPIFYFHGFPGSRLEVEKFNQVALANGCHIISLDRPGFGQSTIDKNRNFSTTIKDLVSLADFLKLDKFAVMGHSGGGPFVAACAHYIPQRLTNAVIVSGMSPFDNPETHIGMAKEQLSASKLVKKVPILSSIFMKITRMMLKKSDKLLDKMIKPLPDVDKAIFLDAEQRTKIISGVLEAFHNGVAGPAYEMKMLLNNWGFKVEDINFPVKIWHGAVDTQVPLGNGKLYNKLIPNSTLHICENDGHHSIMLNRFEQIIQSI